MEFYQKYCTYTCHILRVYSHPKVPLRPLSQTFLRIQKQYFVFVSSPKNKPIQSGTIVLILILWISYRTEDELQSCILVWRDSKKRRVHCRSFARSVDIVAWPVQRRFAFCTSWKVIQRSRRNNKYPRYSTSFPRNQKQQCRNRVQ